MHNSMLNNANNTLFMSTTNQSFDKSHDSQQEPGIVMFRSQDQQPIDANYNSTDLQDVN